MGSQLLECFYRIMVLDEGHIVEFDSPNKLITQQGHFYSLVKDSGLLS